MLHQIYADAIKNKDAVLGSVKDINYDKIIDTAKSNWIKYEPSERKCVSIGIDGSWNKRSFQGLDFYVVDAVAVDSCNNLKAVEWEYGLGVTRSELIEKKGVDLEAKVAEQVINQSEAEVLSIDGSIASRLVRGEKVESHRLLSTVRKQQGVVFISKNSDTMKQFQGYRSLAADMYYYNHIGGEPGFTIPFEDSRFAPFGHIIEVYARLKRDTPLLKLELVHALGEQEVRRLLDALSYHSVAGYPYCLKLAHNNCKIKNEDLDRLSSIYGLRNEPSSREPLGE